MRQSRNAGPTAIELSCACAATRRAARAVSQLYDGYFKNTGLEATQFALLSAIQRLGPCNQAAIGLAFGMDKTTVSRNVTLLKRNRWIEDAPSQDRRHRCFALSASGRKCLAAAKPAWRRAQQRLRSAMTQREWDAMWETFNSLARASGS